jgi:hypothetical protein
MVEFQPGGRAPLPLREVPWVLARFGGEDPVNGSADGVPGSGWYHELITREAARAAGWAAPPVGATGSAVGRTAADALAWHADYLDSYLYNPLWWFNPATGGGLGRLGAALMARPEMVKLHFDDLTSTAQIATMWRRYLGGTVAAVVWAAEHDDVAAARNAIACGLHAMQDFYSHSSWVDSGARRSRTWFEAGQPVWAPTIRTVPGPRPTIPVRPGGSRPRVPLAFPERLTAAPDLGRTLRLIGQDPRPGWDLFTGMYELGTQHGYAHHGAFAFDCTIWRALPSGFRDIAVPVLSFIGMEDMAARWRECTGDSAAPATAPALAGVPAPAGVLVLAPTGIALDSTWMAGISRPNRPLDDASLTGADLFRTARELATRTSAQWLAELERIGRSTLEAINPGFWQRVATQPRTSVGTVSGAAPNPPSPADVRQFEDPAAQPFRMLTAGQYPPDPGETTDGWWLRVTLGTSSTALSGTNADIVLRAGGQEFLLDHGRLRSPHGSWTENRLLEWDDFEAGSRTCYVVGPFATLPNRIELDNRAASALDLLGAAWRGLVDTVAGIVEGIGDALLSLVGGHADLVGSGQRAYGWADLVRIAQQGFPDQGRITVDGGPEGRYRLQFEVWAAWSGDDLLCQVAFRRLDCLEESDWDRFTNEDEPFVLALVTAPAAGSTRSMVLGPYSGVDTGDFRTTSDAAPVLLSVRRGSGLIVAIQVWESDDETPAARDELLEEFASRTGTGAEDPRSEFLDALGTAQAPDWRIADVEVFAFRRNAVVEAGTVLPRQAVGAWLEAGRSRAFPFTQPPRSAVALTVS